MTDDIDRAQERVRKAVPQRCECGSPVAILPNGAHARFCYNCLSDFQAAQAVNLAGDWDASK